MARRIEILFVRYRCRGDVAALGKVFDKAAPEILRVAMHFARHPAEAEDLLQETFLTAIGRAEAYEANRPLIPWLIGILRNHARRRHRQRRRFADALEAAGDEQAHHEPWTDVAWCDEVATAVEALPDPYRQALVLKLRHDKSPAEIAVLLDVPPATVRSQIHRGLERLRAQLKPETRARVLAVLPVGIGLDGVREQVLGHASRVAVTTAAATATLPLVAGGLVMTKQSVLMAGVLLCALVLGSAAWIGGMFAPDELDTERERLLSQREQQDGETQAPVLAGSGEPEEALTAKAAPEVAQAPAATTWPPEREIPEDKGSVAGTIRFEDGTPLVGARIALWGSPCVTAETDAQGRYHIHADWVHERSLFLQLGRDDQPSYLGLMLSAGVAMKNGRLVEQDLTLKRGIEIASMVVDAHNGEPIADANVVLRQQPHARGQANSGFLRTDTQGRFSFPYVLPGKYTIELEAKGYEAKVSEHDLEHGDLPSDFELLRSRALIVQFVNLPEGAIGTKVHFDLSRMDATSFSVMTEPTIAADGTLRVDAPEAGQYRLTLFKSSHLPRLERDIVIPDGALDPIVWTLKEGARVVGTLLDAEGAVIADTRVDIGGAAGRVKTDAEGRFELPYVPAGKRALRVHVGTAWIQFAVVDVPAGGEARFDLRAPGSCTLKGRFYVGDRAADRYASEIQFTDPATKTQVASTRPDAKGQFDVRFLPAGKYQVRAWSMGAMPRALDVELARGQSKDLGTITLVPLERVPVRFVLPSGEEAPKNIPMNVRAFDPSGDPSDAVPSYIEAGGLKTFVSPRVEHDSNGLSWVAALTRGRHRLEINPTGYERITLEVEAKPGLTKPMQIDLTPEAGDR